MTNYDRWGKWSEDIASKECEKKWEEEKIEDDFAKSQKQLRKSTAEVHGNTLKSAEALKSKASVESLKAKMGGGPGRGRIRASTQSSTPEGSIIKNNVEEVNIISKLASKLGDIGTELTAIFERLDIIRNFMTTKTPNSSLIQGMEVLKSIEYLNRCCILLKTSSEWALEDARPCDSLMNDLQLSINALYLETTAALSAIAITVGEFAVACDISRCFLKLSESDSTTSSGNAKAVMFVNRGLAFLCMGSSILAAVHFKEAFHFNSSYPGLERLLKQTESETRQQANNRNKTLLDAVRQELFWLLGSQCNCSVNPPLKYCKISAARLSEIEVPLLIRNRGRAPISNSLCSLLSTSFLTNEPVGKESLYQNIHIDNIADKSYEPIISFDDNCIIDDIFSIIIKFIIHHHYDDNVLLVLLRRIFYEAQSLYLEKLMRSAETKYLVSIALGKAYFRLFNSICSGAITNYVTSVMLCSFINAAICRSSRTPSQQNKIDANRSDFCNIGISDSTAGPGNSYSIEDLCNLDAVILAILATSYSESLITQNNDPNQKLDYIILKIKECLVKEKSGRLTEALDVLVLVEEQMTILMQLMSSTDSMHDSEIQEEFNFVRGYPVGDLLYQSFICAIECTPINYATLMRTNENDAARLAVSLGNSHNIFDVHEYCTEQISFIRRKIITLRNAVKKHGDFRY